MIKFAGYVPSIYRGLTVKKGKVHDYFGMVLDYSKQGTVKVFMIKYPYSVPKEFPDHLSMTTDIPAADELFKLHNESEKHYLPE